MGWVLLFVLLALVFGGFGIIVAAVRWLLILALILLAIGIFAGYKVRR